MEQPQVDGLAAVAEAPVDGLVAAAVAAVKHVRADRRLQHEGYSELQVDRLAAAVVEARVDGPAAAAKHGRGDRHQEPANHAAAAVEQSWGNGLAAAVKHHRVYRPLKHRNYPESIERLAVARESAVDQVATAFEAGAGGRALLGPLRTISHTHTLTITRDVKKYKSADTH